MSEAYEAKLGVSDLVRRIQERYGALRKSERIVADYLREHAGSRMDYTITDLARLLGVSEATVSRVSRALGYSGFPDMKLSLAEGVGQRGAFANIPQEIRNTGSIIGVSADLALILSASIQGTQRKLDADRVERIVAALRTARSLAFVGVGGAAAICDVAAHLFMKAGLNVGAYRDSYTQIIAASKLDENCVLIGISHTGTTLAVADALILARRKGAVTVAITSDANSPVARAAEIVLTTQATAAPSVPLYGDFLEGRISQLFLIDVLYLGLLFADVEDREKHLDETTAALEEFIQNGGRQEPSQD